MTGAGAASTARSAAARSGLGFDRDHFADAGGVVREVEPIAGAEFDDAAAEAVEQLAAVLGGAAALHAI